MISVIDSVSYAPDLVNGVFKIGSNILAVHSPVTIPASESGNLEPFSWSGSVFLHNKSPLVSDATAGDDHVHLTPGEGAKYATDDTHRIIDSVSAEVLQVASVSVDDVYFYSNLSNNYAVAGGARIEPFGSVGSTHTIALAMDIFSSSSNMTMGGICGVHYRTYDGFKILRPPLPFFYIGGGMPGQPGGAQCRGVATDGTYVYALAGYYVTVPSPPIGSPPWVFAWKNRLHAIDIATGSTIKYLDTTWFWKAIIYQGGAIFYLFAGNIRKLTFNGVNFTIVTTVANANIANAGLAGDGTYIYVVSTDGHSIFVYDNNLNLVTTFDTTFSTVGAIRCSGGYVFVTFGGTFATRIYTFDGANFTLIDSTTAAISEAVV